MLEPIPVTSLAELQPGIYYVYLRLPQAVLDEMAERPLWHQDLTQEIFSAFGYPTTFRGGGPTWASIDGQVERIYSMRLQIEPRGSSGGRAAEAAFLAGPAVWPAVVRVAAYLGKIGIWFAVAYGIGAGGVAALFRVVPAEERERAYQTLDWVARAATFGAVAVTVGVGAYVLQRAGVVA